MIQNFGWKWPLVAGVLLLCTEPTQAEQREWTDKSGKHTVEAEFVRIERGKVTLKKADGTESKVPLSKLSKKDQSFLRKLQKAAATSQQTKSESQSKPGDRELTQTATQFFLGLRTESKEQTINTLSNQAKKLAQKDASMFKQFPAPSQGDDNLITGRIRKREDLAEVPVRIRSKDTWHTTNLYFRHEGSQWKVIGLVALSPKGDQAFNFEVEGSKPTQVDPLVALLGQPFQLTGYDIHGSPLDMSQFQGKVVLIEFWATWCGACRAEIPNIVQNWNRYHDQGFEVIAVSLDQDLKTLQSFVAEHQFPWTVMADYHPKNKVSMAATYRIRGIPAFILVGRDGRVAAVHCRGKRLGQQLDRFISDDG